MNFNDLHKQYRAYQSEIDAAIQQTIDNSAFINGPEIGKLEEELATFTGVKHAISCSSGTDALLLSLMALDVQPGDEIICPAFSFIASASMISFYRAKPVFVDVSPVDFNLDITQIEERIGPKTKGIIAVSLFGQCANFDEINAIAHKHGLWVIEDGAQSFGATYKGKRSCSLTHLATTSFFPAKPLGCYGDGGAIFTDDPKLASQIKMLRSHGQKARYVHQEIGINGRIDTLQAAILRVKLKHFEDEIQKRQRAAERYSEKLKGHVLLPEITPDKQSVWAQYTVILENRDEVKAQLAQQGIPTTVHYPVILPKQEAFQANIVFHEKFEAASLLADTVLSLPMHAFITDAEIDLVTDTLLGIVEQTQELHP